jgi:hypothetical protein
VLFMGKKKDKKKPGTKLKLAEIEASQAKLMFELQCYVECISSDKAALQLEAPKRLGNCKKEALILTNGSPAGLNFLSEIVEPSVGGDGADAGSKTNESPAQYALRRGAFEALKFMFSEECDPHPTLLLHDAKGSPYPADQKSLLLQLYTELKSLLGAKHVAESPENQRQQEYVDLFRAMVKANYTKVVTSGKATPAEIAESKAANLVFTTIDPIITRAFNTLLPDIIATQNEFAFRAFREMFAALPSGSIAKTDIVRFDMEIPGYDGAVRSWIYHLATRHIKPELGVDWSEIDVSFFGVVIAAGVKLADLSLHDMLVSMAKQSPQHTLMGLEILRRHGRRQELRDFCLFLKDKGHLQAIITAARDVQAPQVSTRYIGAVMGIAEQRGLDKADEVLLIETITALQLECESVFEDFASQDNHPLLRKDIYGDEMAMRGRLNTADQQALGAADAVELNPAVDRINAQIIMGEFSEFYEYLAQNSQNYVLFGQAVEEYLSENELLRAAITSKIDKVMATAAGQQRERLDGQGSERRVQFLIRKGSERASQKRRSEASADAPDVPEIVIDSQMAACRAFIGDDVKTKSDMQYSLESSSPGEYVFAKLNDTSTEAGLYLCLRVKPPQNVLFHKMDGYEYVLRERSGCMVVEPPLQSFKEDVAWDLARFREENRAILTKSLDREGFNVYSQVDHDDRDTGTAKAKAPVDGMAMFGTSEDMYENTHPGQDHQFV